MSIAVFTLTDATVNQQRLGRAISSMQHRVEAQTADLSHMTRPVVSIKSPKEGHYQSQPGAENLICQETRSFRLKADERIALAFLH